MLSAFLVAKVEIELGILDHWAPIGCCNSPERVQLIQMWNESMRATETTEIILELALKLL